MADNLETFDAMVSLVRKQIPNMEIRYKTDSTLMKVLGVLMWLFNRHFMTRYVTTLYPHVYFPSREFVEEHPWRATKILAHEFVHLWDRKRVGPWFSFRYALPQLLFVVPLLTLIVCSFITIPHKTLWLILLGSQTVMFLLPWPSTGRRNIEIRGYAMSLGVNYWAYGGLTQHSKDWVASQFTGWAYYKMWPFKGDTKKIVDAIEEKLIANHLDWPFSEVKRFVAKYK